ncbi:MAG: hypothetical protein ACTHJ8_07680, partial [Mucilaginibacter sp.]
MRVAFITRSTLYSAPGGDTVQAMQTAHSLQELGISADIKLSNEKVDYSQYDLLHFFNLIRPADILYHSKKAQKPFVVSTILCNYTEYDKQHRKGIGHLFSMLSADRIEYLKTVARWIKGTDHLASKEYLWSGQRNSIIKILKNTRMILPNSKSEYERVINHYPCNVSRTIIPNGIDPELFRRSYFTGKDNKMVLCVARI